MRAGILRHRLTVEQKSATQDSFGQEQINWVTYATVYGSVEPLMGSTYLAAMQAQASISHRVRIRYLSGIKPEIMRITYGSRSLRIISVQDVEERNHEMILMCTEYIDS